MRPRRSIGTFIALAALAACEDPARPVPDAGGATLFVDSDPRGGRVLIDGVDTGELTPVLLDELDEGARNVSVELETAGFTYSYSDIVVVSPLLPDAMAFKPLTRRCTTPQCLRNSSEFHGPQNVRFVVNAAGPLFTYEGVDVGITWPATTSNSYVSTAIATMTALVDGEPVALGLRNGGGLPNYFAGRPLPMVTSTDPYRVEVPAWITPPSATNENVIRGLEVIQEIIVDEELPDVIQIRVTWTNISADSLYRSLDPTSPVEGISYTDAWLGLILDADIGAFSESDDDLVSYSADRNLVFAYDSDLR